MVVSCIFASLDCCGRLLEPGPWVPAQMPTYGFIVIHILKMKKPLWEPINQIRFFSFDLSPLNGRVPVTQLQLQPFNCKS